MYGGSHSLMPPALSFARTASSTDSSILLPCKRPPLAPGAFLGSQLKNGSASVSVHSSQPLPPAVPGLLAIVCAAQAETPEKLISLIEETAANLGS